MTLKSRINSLIKTYGSLSNVASITGVDKAYLHRLLNGAKVNPSVTTLEKLGLRKEVTYRLIK